MPLDAASQHTKPTACAACGASGSVEMHHLVARIHGGDAGPTVPLCGPCHGAAHSVSRPNDLGSLISLGKLEKAHNRAVAKIRENVAIARQETLDAAYAEMDRLEKVGNFFIAQSDEALAWMQTHHRDPTAIPPAKHARLVAAIRAQFSRSSALKAE